MSAPCSLRTRTISSFPSPAATCKAVPRGCISSLISAPEFRVAVPPAWILASTLAPRSSKRAATVLCPTQVARCKGVRCTWKSARKAHSSSLASTST
ncbi:hypothetical protein BJX64DRAFT_261448 [Aspergillus heterothallicus]